MSKAILALDISKSACGWAYGFPDMVPTSGVTPFGKNTTTDDEVWRNALVWMNDQITVLSPAIVAIEAPIMSSAPGQGGFTNPQSQAVLWGLQAVIRTVVKARLPGAAMLVNVASARKILTGKGTYAKGEAKEAVQRECLRRGWLAPENMQADRADALAVWAFAAAQQMPELAFGKARAVA